MKDALDREGGGWAESGVPPKKRRSSEDRWREGVELRSNELSTGDDGPEEVQKCPRPGVWISSRGDRSQKGEGDGARSGELKEEVVAIRRMGVLMVTGEAARETGFEHSR